MQVYIYIFAACLIPPQKWVPFNADPWFNPLSLPAHWADRKRTSVGFCRSQRWWRGHGNTDSPKRGADVKEHWLVVSTHLKNMLVKLDYFPKFRGENKKNWNHHLEHLLKKNPGEPTPQKNIWWNKCLVLQKLDFLPGFFWGGTADFNMLFSSLDWLLCFFPDSPGTPNNKQQFINGWKWWNNHFFYVMIWNHHPIDIAIHLFKWLCWPWGSRQNCFHEPCKSKVQNQKKWLVFRMIPVKDSLYLLPNQSLVNLDLQGKQTQHHPWDWYIYLHLSYHTMKKQPFM